MPVAPRTSTGLGGLIVTAFVALALLMAAHALHQDRLQQIQQQEVH
jgi:hypothetical protein